MGNNCKLTYVADDVALYGSSSCAPALKGNGMFSFFSLEKRKKAVNVSAYMRRICDLSVPNRRGWENQARLEDRYNRTFPTLLCPWNNGFPSAEEAEFAVTKDISDRGVSVVTVKPIDGQLVVAFTLPKGEASDPWFFLGQTVRSAPIGGRHWVTGIELTEFITNDYRHELRDLYPLAQQLLPDATADS